ncbi:hypothetical protein KUCAC02_015893 [Chaenocephalus aceratus]|uniref:Uncharacterized protein n=1 Tax=Chaenocephalus aceratus TaxID=36190 RepID=A0ACB9Y164_CHAAC|nr:hypothetical protein KUCAC02_015893 [Chaenocephalus aceratus]
MTSVGELRLSRKPDFKGEARGEKHGNTGRHNVSEQRAAEGSRSEDARRRLTEPWDNEAWDETTVKRDWRNLRQTVGRLVLSEPGSYSNCSGGRLFQMSGGYRVFSHVCARGRRSERFLPISITLSLSGANGAEQGRKYSGHNETDDNKAEDGEMAVTEKGIQGSRLTTYHLSNSRNSSTKSFSKTKPMYSAKQVNLANFGPILLKFSELDSPCESVPGGSFCLYVWGIVCDAPIHILWAIFDPVTERRAENRGFPPVLTTVITVGQASNCTDSSACEVMSKNAVN